MLKNYQRVFLWLKDVLQQMLLIWPQFHLLLSTLCEAESKIAQLGIELSPSNQLRDFFSQNEMKKVDKASTW